MGNCLTLAYVLPAGSGANPLRFLLYLGSVGLVGVSIYLWQLWRQQDEASKDKPTNV